MAEADAPAAVPDEDAALGQAAQADAGVELRLGGDAAALELLQHALDLVAAELDAEHRREARVREQVGRQRLGLAAGQPLHERQIGQPLELVGGEEPALPFSDLRTRPSRLRPRTSSTSSSGTPCVRSARRASALAGTFSPATSRRRASSAAAARLERRQRELAGAPPRGPPSRCAPCPNDGRPTTQTQIGHAGLRQRRVLDRVERGLVDEVRVVDDQRERPLARHAGAAPRRRARAAAERSAPGAAASARSSGCSGGAHPIATATPAQTSCARVGAELLGQQRAPEIGGRRVGERQRALQELARRLLADAAQHLLGAHEQRLHARQHLEVLHQHLREVGLAVPRLAEQRGDGRRGVAGRARAPRRAARAGASSRPTSGATPMRVVVRSAACVGLLQAA